MLIRQTRIRNLERHIPEEHKGRLLQLGIIDLEQHQDRLRRIGFSEVSKAGDSVLPAIVGPISRYNAEGRQIVRRDLPMETAYRQTEWHWNEFHGNEQVEQSGIRDVPYKRYPRDFLPPPSIELEMRSNAQNQLVVTTKPIEYSDDHRNFLLHTINLYLELFGECHILSEDLLPAMKEPTKRLNWQILPPGKYPWERVQTAVQPIVTQAKRGNQAVINRRLEVVSESQPEFVAIGQAGFNGYIVFGFPAKNLYVLESAFYGNATYVFEENWESLSQKTKAEILNEALQKARIIHISGWEQAIRALLK